MGKAIGYRDDDSEFREKTLEEGSESWNIAKTSLHSLIAVAC
jgi:hypothetical protein